jgi:hypothetical protein
VAQELSDSVGERKEVREEEGEDWVLAVKSGSSRHRP